MQNTMDFFKKDVEELTTIENNFCTVEENLLSTLGKEVIFFDDLEEKNQDWKDIEKYLEQKNLKVTQELITINERIAVILNKA